MDQGKLIRKVGLVAMIVAYGGLLAALALIPHWGFFWTFVLIGLVVGGGEIVSVVITGKTLSTNFKYAVQRGGRDKALAFVALGCLGAAIAALIVHLGVAW